MPMPGWRSMNDTRVPMVSGETKVSGFNSSTYRLSDCVMAQLFAAAKPRFDSLWVSRTAGNSAATMAALPSDDPLSTTCTSNARPFVAITDRRQSASSVRVFKLTIEIVTSIGLVRDSGGITIRETFSPHPRTLHNRLERALSRPPLQDPSELRGRCYQHRRISGTSPAQDMRDAPFDHRLGGTNDLHHGIAGLAADVEAVEADLIDVIERGQMGSCDIRHVDVIANAGAIRSRVISPVNRQGSAFSGGRGKRQRNQVSLLRPIFAVSGGSARGIEVAETDGTKAVGTVKPGEAPLEHQFRFAVRVDRLQRMIL